MRSASSALEEKNSASTAPNVSNPPRGAVSTLCTSFAIGPATSFGQAPNIRLAASSERSCEPKKPASAVTKIKNGNSEVSIASAMLLEIGQPSSTKNLPIASMTMAANSRMQNVLEVSFSVPEYDT